MRTSDFLRLVLPEAGNFYFAARQFPVKSDPTKRWWKNIPHTDIQQLALQLKQITLEGADAYFALASYEESRYWDENAPNKKGGFGKFKDRTQPNAQFVRSQWLDLDCGEGKEFPDQRTAVKTLVGVLRELALPMPTLFVNSGRGIHVYWVFDKDIKATVWTVLAGIFKEALHAKAFKADPSRTADVASVLRPVGCKNFKRGGAGDEVSLFSPVGSIVPFNTWARGLYDLKDTFGPRPATKRTATTDKNSDLFCGNEFPPAYADRVADYCPTLARMRDLKGADQSEPAWKACLGLLSFCADGEAVYQDWSSMHKGYTQALAREKFEHTKSTFAANGWGAPTCNAMSRAAGNSCEGCKNRCNSPISLGFEPVTVTVEEPETGEKLPTLPASMCNPKKKVYFGYDTKRGLVMVSPPEEAGAPPVSTVICSSYVVAKDCYIHTDGQWMLRCAHRPRPGKWYDFEIPVAALGGREQTLMTALGKNGIVGHDKGMVRYMRSWYDEITRGDDPALMRRAFGWQTDGSFALGHDLYMPDGSIKECNLEKGLSLYANGHIPTGELSRQIELVDKLYNRPGMESRQFVLASALGSILVGLVHDAPVGIPIALHSPESGTGKTTTCEHAIGFWGDPNANAQGTDAQGATETARYVMCGLRRNLPVLIDETTAWADGRDPATSAKMISDFLYRLSSGRPKLLGATDGGLRDTSHLMWQTFIYTTANKSLVDVMTGAMADAAPQSMRIFEIQFHKTDIDMVHDKPFADELRRHTGHIGREFLKIVLRNRDAIAKAVTAEQQRIHSKVDPGSDARFWVLAAACTNVALKLANKFGLFRFNVAAFTRWVDFQVGHLRVEQRAALQTAEDLLARMFSDLIGGTLVTDTRGDMRGREGSKPCFIDKDFRVPQGRSLIGRYITDENRWYVTVKAVRDWCTRNGVEYKRLRRDLMSGDEGIRRIRSADHPMYLTQGTRLNRVALARCWDVNVYGGPQVLRNVESCEVESENG